MNGKAIRWVFQIVCLAGLVNFSSRAAAQADMEGLRDSPSQTSESMKHSNTAVQREVSWHSLPKDFLHDQKKVWTFPVQLAKGRHWVPTLAIAGITGGLIVADSHAMPYFRNHSGQLDDVN